MSRSFRREVHFPLRGDLVEWKRRVQLLPGLVLRLLGLSVVDPALFVLLYSALRSLG